ncbi:MAG: biopolymer transporter Tol [Ignavibacteriaceae bacterium]|nr:biopolymer transporter Tol [Ignavibacteriaceae bacterium]
MRKIFPLFVVLLFIPFTQAQFTEFHPELEWYTIKGENCVVHYHKEAERTAKVTAKICDEIWEPITRLYGYEPETVHFVIKDIDDYSNGATYFFDNKIEIWTSALDFDLRGTHNWLRNVISHEFTHLVQIQAALKTGRRVPAVYLQWLNYEDKRRPDILYGFPNVIVSYPLATLNMPAWFAEGTAQYMREEFNYDYWDAHRDMILRSYVTGGNMLTWNQMGVFEKTSLGNESIYNSGFALTRFISQKYGEDKLREITNRLGVWSNFTIDAAIEDVLGITGRQLYNEWKSYLENYYKTALEPVRSNAVTGTQLNTEGFGNFYPVFADSGRKILYISNSGNDYMSLTSLYEYDLEKKQTKRITGPVRSTFGLFDSENKILYAKITDDNENWYNVHDLFVYDRKTEEETRLTFNLRANQPSLSHKKDKVVFVFQKDGTTNLATVNIDGTGFTQLTFFANGEQIYNPSFSPDDSRIIFDYSDFDNRDVAVYSFKTGKHDFLLEARNDERNAFFLNDTTVVFSADYNGIFNIHKFIINKGQIIQLTNVEGGAFMPAIDRNGDIAYSGYTSTGYKIFHLSADSLRSIAKNDNYKGVKEFPLNEFKPIGDLTDEQIQNFRNFKDNILPEYESSRYSGAFSKLTFFPVLRLDNYNTGNTPFQRLKPGVYFTSSDMLNRYSIFGGATINTRFERDLFMMFEYKNKIPLLYDIGIKPEIALELFNVSRKADVDIIFDEDLPTVTTDVTYNLFEVGLKASHRIFTRDQNLEFRYAFSRYTASLGSFILPLEGDPQLYPTTNDEYLIGNNFMLKYTYSSLFPYVDSDINPVGTQIDLTYNLELNKYNPDGNYTIDNGILVPLYSNFNFSRLELLAKHNWRLTGSHGLELTIRGGTIIGAEVPDFFDFYLGGLVGMRSYPFYSLSGNEIAMVKTAYRFPLFKNIDFSAGHLYLDKIFLEVFAEAGNAWNSYATTINNIKKGAGAELRFSLNSFYLFPTAIFLNAAYGFDSFERNVRDEKVMYGKEWNFYAGVLFGFDI